MIFRSIHAFQAIVIAPPGSRQVHRKSEMFPIAADMSTDDEPSDGLFPDGWWTLSGVSFGERCFQKGARTGNLLELLLLTGLILSTTAATPTRRINSVRLLTRRRLKGTSSRKSEKSADHRHWLAWRQILTMRSCHFGTEIPLKSIF